MRFVPESLAMEHLYKIIAVLISLPRLLGTFSRHLFIVTSHTEAAYHCLLIRQLDSPVSKMILLLRHQENKLPPSCPQEEGSLSKAMD